MSSAVVGSDISHVQSLDVVRAFAIIGVLMTHASVPGFAIGWVGVDLFFALSGFLITTLLLKEQQRFGGIATGAFLGRRALRLFPAYGAYLLMVTYGMWFWSGSELSTHGGWTPLQFFASPWTYTVNFAPFGGIWNGQVITLHLWSLAVEQQFYVVWIVVMVALASRPPWLLAAGIALSLACLALYLNGTQPSVLLHKRGYTLFFGSTTAILAFHHRHVIRHAAWRGIGWAGLGGVAFAAVWAELRSPSLDGLWQVLMPLMSLGFCTVIAVLWYEDVTAPWLKKLFAQPVLVYVGKISYGIYVYHELVRVLVWTFGKPLMEAWPAALGFGARLGIYLLVTLLISAASYHFLELRFLRMKSGLRPKPVRAHESIPEAR